MRMDAKEFRNVGHQVVDLLADYMASIDQKPITSQVEPGILRRLFDEPLPQRGMAAEDILKEVRDKLLPNCVHVSHPGYFGLITPTPAPVGILGDFIASAINQNPGSYVIGPAATEMERRTIRWLSDLIGFGAHAGGNLTSGGTMANLIAAKLGRDFVSDNIASIGGFANRTRRMCLKSGMSPWTRHSIWSASDVRTCEPSPPMMIFGCGLMRSSRRSQRTKSSACGLLSLSPWRAAQLLERLIRCRH